MGRLRAAGRRVVCGGWCRCADEREAGRRRHARLPAAARAGRQRVILLGASYSRRRTTVLGVLLGGASADAERGSLSHVLLRVCRRRRAAPARAVPDRADRRDALLLADAHLDDHVRIRPVACPRAPVRGRARRVHRGRCVPLLVLDAAALHPGSRRDVADSGGKCGVRGTGRGHPHVQRRGRLGMG